MTDIADYYRRNFRSDLAALMAPWGVPCFGHAWSHGCPGLDRVPKSSRACFLICLYFTVLVDQAMHAHHRSQYDTFERLTRHPKFCRGLGQFQRGPREILAVPVAQRLVDREELHSRLAAGLDVFVAEARSFFRDHMPMISAADFFERLCHDPDVQIPANFASPGGRVAASVEYRVSRELREAVRRAAPGRTFHSGHGD